GLSVLLTPVEKLVEDLRDRRAFRLRHARRRGLGYHQLVERLHDGGRGVPLALLLARGCGVGWVCAEKVALAVLGAVPAVAVFAEPGERSSRHGQISGRNLRLLCRGTFGEALILYRNSVPIRTSPLFDSP